MNICGTKIKAQYNNQLTQYEKVPIETEQNNLIDLTMDKFLVQTLCIRDDVKLAKLFRAWDCQSRGRRFDSGKNLKNREVKSTWI